MTTVEEEGKKDGVWGLPSEKFVRTTPFRASENALSEHRVNLDMKDEQAKR